MRWQRKKLERRALVRPLRVNEWAERIPKLKVRRLEAPAYWGHIGYPNDLAGGQQPAFIGYQSFIDVESESTGGHDSFLIDHDIDVIPGQSGGPYFGWRDNEPWPRVVSIQSGEQHGGATGPNDCGGGNPLPDLIIFALANDP